jgi:hypothetical protein
VNTIWDISRSNGSRVNTFKDITEVGEQHFKYLFKDHEVANIEEIKKIVSLFLRVIDDEMNVEL